MIEVDRSRVQRPDCLDPDDPDSSASKEKAKAIAHVEDPAANKKPKFDTYSKDEVKLALYTLFRKKCAYCEKPTTSDIEHFRPKGRIDPGGGQEALVPGYYWLAADWDNLLLSCVDCNQSRRNLEIDDNGDLVFADETTGKLDKFPLSDETKRVRSHDGDLTEEDPPVRLLLNPCIDNPGRHIRFDLDGNVLPRQIQGEVSPMATASIDVFDLKRLDLNEARKKVREDMEHEMQNLRDLAQNIDLLADRFKTLAFGVLTSTEERIESFTAETQPYTAMSQRVARDLRKELAQIRELLIDKLGAP